MRVMTIIDAVYPIIQLMTMRTAANLRGLGVKWNAVPNLGAVALARFYAERCRHLASIQSSYGSSDGIHSWSRLPWKGMLSFPT